MATKGIGPLNENGDIGYRGLVCFNGYLIASPASSFNSDSEDVSENPFLLGNWNPSRGGDWQTLVDFRNYPNIDFQQNGDFIDLEDTYVEPVDTSMGDPSNYGAFDIKVMEGDIWVAVSNRGKNGGPDRGGVELWRGDGAGFGTECFTFNPEVPDDGCAGIAWNKVIDVGAGRREDTLGPDIDNALGTFGILHDPDTGRDNLYMALWESGFESGSRAELIRIDPMSETPGSEQWELLIGGGRLDYAGGYGTASGTMICDAANQYEDKTPALGDVPGDASDCYPSTGRNMGFGAIQALDPSAGGDTGAGGAPTQFDDQTPPNPVEMGGATYFWRLGSHLNSISGLEELYLGTYSSGSLTGPGSLCGGEIEILGIPIPLPDCVPDEVDGGFELYKTTSEEAGDAWSQLSYQGFENPFNYGVRSILSVQLPDAPVEEPVLFIGTANPYTNVPDVVGAEAFWGGTEVFMGTFSVPPTTPPTNIVASNGEVSDKITISWDAYPDALSYKVFRSETSDLDTAQELTTVDAPASSYEDYSATFEVGYYYWVKAYSEDSVSEFSLPDEGLLLAPPIIPPQNVVASNGEVFDKVTISWEASPGAVTYKIFRSETPGSGTALVLATVEAPATIYDDVSASAGVGYYYWVKAYSAYTESEFSLPDEGLLLEGCTLYIIKARDKVVSFCL
ncbi:MAG: hypothetical protein GY726_14100 [Proteobacteria bacterium]|nr:hypothetical protein [Pseudomonadota bacterium]